jgi:methionine-rich copper-binding protein CopC
MKLSLRSPRIWVASLSVAFLAVGSVGLDVSSASAHAHIVSTTPSNGSHVALAPSEITLVFSNSILDIGPTILVVDSAGANWASGQMATAGATVTQPVKAGLPAGNYRVRWRVVSADGHPLSGTFDFTTTTGPIAPPAAVAAAPVTSSTAAAPAATSGPTGTDTGASAARGGLPLPVVGALGAVGGVGIFALIVALRRNTKPIL